MDLDVILVHAPSVYDFRDRDDVSFPYLGNSDSVHVSPIFEMPPIGLLAIKQHLVRCGLHVELFNVAARMLRDEGFDVEAFLERVAAPLFGVDLHWMAHCHGALALAELYKSFHPDAQVMVGGISATYFHEELLQYPQVDYVVRGFDTLRPIEELIRADRDPRRLARVPNLTWRRAGEVVVNPMSHAPKIYSAAIEWSEVFSGADQGRTRHSVTIPQAGCEYDCRFCGGGRRFARKVLGIETGVAQRTPDSLRAELESVVASASHPHTVTMIDFWHEHPRLFDVAADVFRHKHIGSVHYSLHRLPPIAQARRMAKDVRAIMELSPDSHDLEVARSGGRGKYTVGEMEDWIDDLLDDVHGFEIYFMIGLPGQDAASVAGTVDYCGHLLEKYRRKRVYPYLCPMLPFLDPGSEFFEEPDKWGFTIYHHSLEEHRQALCTLNWVNRANYETRWLSRRELLDLSYESVLELAALKHRYGAIPERFLREVSRLIDSTRSLLGMMDDYESLPAGEEKAAALRNVKSRVLSYNQNQLRTVRSQQRPMDFGFAKNQWFDTDAAFRRVLP